MANVKLGDKPLGSIVKLNVNGAQREFIIVQHGRPSSIYDNGWNNVSILLMKAIYTTSIYSTGTLIYSQSTLHTYLSGTFITLLDEDIQNTLQSVKVPYVSVAEGANATVSSGANGLSCKAFLLSHKEVNGIFRLASNSKARDDGAVFTYFNTDDDSIKIADRGDSGTTYWWTRSTAHAYSYGPCVTYYDHGMGLHRTGVNSQYGVRPALAFPSTMLVSDDGALLTNQPPTPPPAITVPDIITGGASNTISWTAATDPDGNLAGYELERADGAAAYTQRYRGPALSHADPVDKGIEQVTYRVRAYDEDGACSDYTTGPARAVDNNTAPVIACAQNGNIGDKSDGFTVDYTVTDPENDAVTVVEAMDAATKRSFPAQLGAVSTFDVSGTYFQQLLNGAHELTITATDAKGKASTHTLLWTKTVHSCRITLKDPMRSDTPITKMVMSVVGSIPADAQYKVLVTNNAADSAPVWEDITATVQSGLNHLFENTTAQNGFAFNFIITAGRGPSGGSGFISSIGGAFE